MKWFSFISSMILFACCFFSIPRKYQVSALFYTCRVDLICAPFFLIQENIMYPPFYPLRLRSNLCSFRYFILHLIFFSCFALNSCIFDRLSQFNFFSIFYPDAGILFFLKIISWMFSKMYWKIKWFNLENFSRWNRVQRIIRCVENVCISFYVFFIFSAF